MKKDTADLLKNSGHMDPYTHNYYRGSQILLFDASYTSGSHDAAPHKTRKSKHADAQNLTRKCPRGYSIPKSKEPQTTTIPHTGTPNSPRGRMWASGLTQETRYWKRFWGIWITATKPTPTRGFCI